MTTASVLHASPAYPTVVRQQGWLLWATLRGPFLVGALVLITLMLESAYRAVAGEGMPRGMLSPTAIEMMGWLWAIGLFWGSAVWRDEGPAKRAYHTALPVDRAAHDLARVLAGAAWLCLAVALMLVTGYLAAAQGGGGGALRALPAWIWVSAFVTPLLMYTLTSAFAVVLNRPAEWMLLCVIAIVGMSIVGAWLGLDWLLRAAQMIGGGDYGLAPTLSHGTTTAKRLLAGVNPAAGVDATALASMAELKTQWVAGIVIWSSIAVGALAFAVTRRRLA